MGLTMQISERRVPSGVVCEAAFIMNNRFTISICERHSHPLYYEVFSSHALCIATANSVNKLMT